MQNKGKNAGKEAGLPKPCVRTAHAASELVPEETFPSETSTVTPDTYLPESPFAENDRAEK